jgi:hypothetical protein
MHNSDGSGTYVVKQFHSGNKSGILVTDEKLPFLRTDWVEFEDVAKKPMDEIVGKICHESDSSGVDIVMSIHHRAHILST